MRLLVAGWTLSSVEHALIASFSTSLTLNEHTWRRNNGTMCLEQMTLIYPKLRVCTLHLQGKWSHLTRWKQFPNVRRMTAQTKRLSSTRCKQEVRTSPQQAFTGCVSRDRTPLLRSLSWRNLVYQMLKAMAGVLGDTVRELLGCGNRQKHHKNCSQRWTSCPHYSQDSQRTSCYHAVPYLTGRAEMRDLLIGQGGAKLSWAQVSQ